jgi:hypothetical protein
LQLAYNLQLLVTGASNRFPEAKKCFPRCPTPRCLPPSLPTPTPLVPTLARLSQRPRGRPPPATGAPLKAGAPRSWRRSVARIPGLCGGVPGRHGRAWTAARDDSQTVCGRYHQVAGVDPLPTEAAIVKATMKGLRRSLGTAQASACFQGKHALGRRRQRTLSQSAWSTPCPTIHSRVATTAHAGG